MGEMSRLDINIRSEVGDLRAVIVHTPGNEMNALKLQKHKGV